ncbi:hypothetical protein [Solihabitans fulvus]|uniref:hypothetical protein n=1 Tax=Solihabitans fulvus TaxID=1892852 RepID=UPI001662178E|nr:hypothetical protein [Solihabitans fulvus]
MYGNTGGFVGGAGVVGAGVLASTGFPVLLVVAVGLAVLILGVLLLRSSYLRGRGDAG